MIIRYIAAVSLCICALAAIGCGGMSTGATSSSTGGAVTSSGTSGESPTQSAANAVGAKVFASNCAQCHTLAAAGSNGQVGPNLDDLAPDEATIKAQVTNGGSGMPAFADVLSNAEIDAVTAYVADSTGQ